jgi:hypothetical protein
MPKDSELPRGMKGFAFLNAVEVESGKDFNVHMERLIRTSDQAGAQGGHMDGAVSFSSGGLVGNGSPTGVDSNARGGANRFVAGTQVFSSYLFLLVSSLALAHYFIIVKFDLDPLYLRVVAVVVPLVVGFAFVWQSRGGWVSALLVDLAAALIAVMCMLVTISFIDGTPVVPSTALEWQEALEYFVAILLGALTGNVIARSYRHYSPS